MHQPNVSSRPSCPIMSPFRLSLRSGTCGWFYRWIKARACGQSERRFYDLPCALRCVEMRVWNWSDCLSELGSKSMERLCVGLLFYELDSGCMHDIIWFYRNFIGCFVWTRPPSPGTSIQSCGNARWLSALLQFWKESRSRSQFYPHTTSRQCLRSTHRWTIYYGLARWLSSGNAQMLRIPVVWQIHCSNQLHGGARISSPLAVIGILSSSIVLSMSFRIDHILVGLPSALFLTAQWHTKNCIDWNHLQRKNALQEGNGLMTVLLQLLFVAAFALNAAWLVLK